MKTRRERNVVRALVNPADETRGKEGTIPAPVAEPGVLARALRVSINPSLINKNERGDKTLFVEGWKNVELTLPQLRDSVLAGAAYCAQLAGERRQANFLACDVVSVDIDGNRTLDDVMADPTVRRAASMIYTTPSHTPAEPHLRIVFVLPRTITDPREMRAVARSLSLRLAGDPSVTDAARIFYGSRGGQAWLFDRGIDDHLLDELLSQTPQQPRGDGPAAPTAAARSVISFRPGRVVKLARGGEMPFADVPARAAIYCPFHYDLNASAFVVSNRHGIRGIHCSTCDNTYWPAGSSPGDYDFGAFEEEVRRVFERYKTHEDMSPLAVFNTPLSRIGLTTTVRVVSGLPAPEKLEPGVTFIKSGKGTGKTESLARLLRKFRKVVLVGHRRALINQSCARLGLTSYLDCKPGKWGKFDVDRLGICLDSLTRIADRKQFDVVVLDESEQVLGHLLSETIETRLGGAGRDGLFDRLWALVAGAKHVVALDADLGFATFATISRMVSRMEAREGEEPIAVPTRPLRVWLNEGKPKTDTVQMFESERQLTAELMTDLRSGKRCFVTSNSKRLIERIAGAIRSELPDRCRLIVVTSETVNTGEVREFVGEPSRLALSYDAIMTSPSLGTGVDITFPRGAKSIDVVFGFFHPLITTHFDFDQQLARVRHPGATKVWVSPRTFAFETNEEAVRIDLQRKFLVRHTLMGFDDDGEPVYRQYDPLVEMAALITAQARASKNAPRRNFVRHKQEQGNEIIWVRPDAALDADGRRLLDVGKRVSDEEYAASVTAAVPLRRASFKLLARAQEGDEPIAEADRWSLERTRIELFYRREANRELVALDDRGRYRRRVAMFEHVFHATRDRWEHVLDPPPLNKHRARFVASHDATITAIRTLLDLAPVLLDGHLDRGLLIDARGLARFAKYLLANKAAIENLLGIEVRRNVADDPVRQLNAVLSLMGVTLIPAGSIKVEGRKIYRYRLDHEKLARVLAVVEARRAKAWRTLAQLHGWRSELDPGDGDDLEGE